MTLLEFLGWALLAVNLLAFLAVGIDKALARRGGRRIAEGFLLTLALCGGFLAVWLGMSAFRHKTVKRSFQWKLLGVTALNALWVFLFLRYR